jgi:hypothetical protein
MRSGDRLDAHPNPRATENPGWNQINCNRCRGNRSGTMGNLKWNFVN